VLAIPTESSYGLAVDPRNAEGIARVYGLKGRDGSKALPLVAADRAQIDALGLDTGPLDRPELAPLVARGWPGPLSVVLALAGPDGALHGGAPDGTWAVRIPGHDGLRELLAGVGRALTATSANRSGEPPLLDPDGAAALLAGLPEGAAAVIDGGVLPGGPPSTLIRLSDGRVEVLRAGAFDPFENDGPGDDRPGARTE
jgi:L-threonylcarbamoyladenylate synthase